MMKKDVVADSTIHVRFYGMIPPQHIVVLICYSRNISVSIIQRMINTDNRYTIEFTISLDT